MPVTIGYQRAFYRTLQAMQRELSALFGQYAQRIGGVLLAASGPDGMISQESQERTRIAVGRVVDEMFTAEQPGRRGNHAYSFDGVTPLAPYPALLNKYLVRATREAVEPHTRYMQRIVPDDVKIKLTSRSRRIAEQEGDPGPDPGGHGVSGVSPSRRKFLEDQKDLRLFQPNPLAEYEQPHTWVDPNGYRLSDRIWRTDEETRRGLDQLMARMMAEGRSAADIAKAVARYLVPAERLKTTTKPYGEKYGKYSYSAMRLARSEITRAAGWAQKMAALANPYVDMMDWVLSASHPRADICDTLADGGPYSVEDAPVIVQDSHPMCVTPGQLVETSRGKVPIERVARGDLVLTHESEYRPVLSAWNRYYSGPIYQVHTNQGDFTLTSKHPVLLDNGWVEVEALQVGDNVAHTGINIGVDLSVSEPIHEPAERAQFSIADNVMFDNGLHAVPVHPVAFYIDLAMNNSKVKEVFTRMELAFKRYVMPFKGLLHSNLNTGRTQDTNGAHGDQAGVMEFFSSRNLSSYFRSLGRVRTAFHVEPLTPFTALISGLLPPGSIVALPLSSNGTTSISRRNINQSKQLSQHAKCDSQLNADFWRSKFLNYVEIVKDSIKSLLCLGFNAETVPFYLADPVLHSMAVGINEQLPANRAGFGEFHGNLSALPLGAGMGTAPRNAVVGRFMRPSQAQLNYTPILDIKRIHYDGLVYNMHVEIDNSYTVGGFVVHNCICHTRSIVSQSPADVTARLRAALEESEQLNLTPYMTPLEIEGFMSSLLGDALFKWVAQLGREVIGV